MENIIDDWLEQNGDPNIAKEVEKTLKNLIIHGVRRRANKFYFRRERDILCYDLNYHLVNARYEGLTEIELIEAVPEKVTGMFWCKAFDEVGEDGCCGKDCIEYKPKNKVSGMCNHQTKTFYTQGVKVKFNVV